MRLDALTSARTIPFLALLVWGTTTAPRHGPHELARPRIVADDSVRVSARPGTVYLERSRFGQALNFDLVIRNGTSSRLYVRNIEILAFDAAGRLTHRDFVSPYERASLELSPEPALEPGREHLLFNPVALYPTDVPLHHLRYELTLSSADHRERYTAVCTVSPVPYLTKTDLVLPLKGRVLVWDGHDYNSHHRRLNYLEPYFARRGATANFQRYGYDFVIVDSVGTMYRGPAKNPEDWYLARAADNADYYAFGAPVYAAGAGRVVDVHDGEPDNRQFDEAELARREKAYGGNYVIIDHLNGEFSWFGHLRQGSIRVAAGQRVRQGEVIAAVGASGSSLFPHLHYELRNGSGANAVEGLPSVFRDFTRVLGTKRVRVPLAPVETGDLVESAR
jgi:hypothetical protein